MIRTLALAKAAARLVLRRDLDQGREALRFRDRQLDELRAEQARFAAALECPADLSPVRYLQLLRTSYEQERQARASELARAQNVAQTAEEDARVLVAQLDAAETRVKRLEDRVQLLEECAEELRDERTQILEVLAAYAGPAPERARAALADADRQRRLWQAQVDAAQAQHRRAEQELAALRGQLARERLLEAGDVAVGNPRRPK